MASLVQSNTPTFEIPHPCPSISLEKEKISFLCLFVVQPFLCLFVVPKGETKIGSLYSLALFLDVDDFSARGAAQLSGRTQTCSTLLVVKCCSKVHFITEREHMHVLARANLYVLKFPPCFCRGEKTIHYLAQVLGQVMDLLRLAERELVVVELHFFVFFRS